MSGAAGQADHAYYAQQDLINEGREKEWEVVVADENHIQIDYDTTLVPMVLFEQSMGLLKKRLGQDVVSYKFTESRSGNKHAYHHPA